jgi:hypothetical protein
LGLRFKASAPQDEGTRQPNILRRRLYARNNYSSNQSGFCSQDWFLLPDRNFGQFGPADLPAAGFFNVGFNINAENALE